MYTKMFEQKINQFWKFKLQDANQEADDSNYEDSEIEVVSSASTLK